MATNATTICASPETVFRLATMGHCYAPPSRWATVEVHLEEVASGTHLTMREELGVAPGAIKRAADRMIQLRNARGLRRLGKLCERQSDPTGRIGAPSARRGSVRGSESSGSHAAAVTMTGGGRGEQSVLLLNAPHRTEVRGVRRRTGEWLSDGRMTGDRSG